MLMGPWIENTKMSARVIVPMKASTVWLNQIQPTRHNTPTKVMTEHKRSDAAIDTPALSSIYPPSMVPMIPATTVDKPNAVSALPYLVVAMEIP